jgi:pimeloyl-ACP methyl ester carboxylesterase
MTAPAPAATLAVPGATLHHEVRGDGPLLVLLGTPMGARAFEPLADRLAVDHTVLTTDPRGISRSPVDDPDDTPTLERRATDVAALIGHTGHGAATVLGSSGGAVTALALRSTTPTTSRP